MSLKDTYIQYGVPSDWANGYESLKLPVATFKATSSKNLEEKYHIPKVQISFVKKFLKRAPIDEDVMFNLLHRNRFTCCLCRGQKGTAYIIHHITPYADTQDNSEENLAVLCPNDHDLVHREGENLTQKISADDVRKAKYMWQEKVIELDAQAASVSGEIGEVDFINVPRVLALYQEIFHKVPETDYSSHLIRDNLIMPGGELNHDYIKKYNKNPATPFIFIGPDQSWHLSVHYAEAFKQILRKVSFIDLDSLLTKRKINSPNIVGTYCYYVGGLYGKLPTLPISDTTAPTHLYFHRRDFFVEWMVDAKYMVSNTALHRLPDHNEYLIYGVIRGVGLKTHNSKEYIHIDIRPYLFGMPLKTKSRRPAIHYFYNNPEPESEELDDL